MTNSTETPVNLSIVQEELRGFSRSFAELEWLMLILCLLYLFVPGAVYEQNIKNWLEYFPREQVHIISMNEYSVNRAKVLGDIYNFLSLCTYNIIIIDLCFF